MQVDSVTIPDDLFLQAKLGDREATSALWATCRPIVAEAVRRSRANPKHTIQPADVAQEASRLFLAKLRGDECPDAATLLRYLIQKLPNRLSSYLRAERRRLSRQALAEESEIERAMARGRTTPYLGAPPGRKIARALERLSPRQRAVIAGLYFRELKGTELAAELGVTQQRVSALHREALSLLRDALSEEPPTEEESVI